MTNKTICEPVNGKKIFCLFSEQVNNNGKLVIMCHGFKGSNIKPSKIFIETEIKLLENGFSVLRFDQPNSGNSEGDFIDSSFNEWVKTIVFLINKYNDKEYKIILFGQSMGATAAMIAATQKETCTKIEKITLLVPDPKSDFDGDPEIVAEEGGQKYKQAFWQEAKQMNFMECLDKYKGEIFLVYGSQDKYISEKIRKSVTEKVMEKKGKILILEGENHGDWKDVNLKRVLDEEINFLIG